MIAAIVYSIVNDSKIYFHIYHLDNVMICQKLPFKVAKNSDRVLRLDLLAV